MSLYDDLGIPDFGNDDDSDDDPFTDEPAGSGGGGGLGGLLNLPSNVTDWLGQYESLSNTSSAASSGTTGDFGTGDFDVSFGDDDTKQTIFYALLAITGAAWLGILAKRFR